MDPSKGLIRAACLVGVLMVSGSDWRVGRQGADPLDAYGLDADPQHHWSLPNRLREISGLAADPSGRLFGHDDETGIIYELDLQEQRFVKAWALGSPVLQGDFEGIAFAGGRFYLIDSRGRLFETGEGQDDERLRYNRYETGLDRICEVEGLTTAATGDELLVLCKTPLVEALRDVIAVYRWSIARRAMVSDTPMTIPLRDVLPLVDRDEFHPSAIDRDPTTGHWYILAGPERAIVVVTPEGEVLGGRRLSREHRQPEGLVVASDGRLIIADEGAGDRAQIAVYDRR